MCGRYTQKQKTEIIKKTYGIEKVIAVVSASFNVCPGQDVATIAGHRERRLGTLHWGLPSAGKGNRPLINARAETLSQKPTFAPLLARRRCLIVADGYYEWQQLEGRRQPFYIYMKDESPFVFAGLWNSVQTAEGQTQAHCTIVTTASNALLSQIHHRMPAIIPPASIDAWLDPKCKNPSQLLKPYAVEAMKWHPVSNAINSPRNDSPELVESLTNLQ